MSDWGATHSTSINEGLDQEMSGGLFFHQALKLAVTEGRVAVAKVDESVTRILIPMFEMGLFENAQQVLPRLFGLVHPHPMPAHIRATPLHELPSICAASRSGG